MNRKSAGIVVVSAFFSACSSTMPPVEDRGDVLVYQHMRPEFDRAQAAAIERCAADGREAKHEISSCWLIGDRPDIAHCFDTPLCERCRSTFFCRNRTVERLQP